MNDINMAEEEKVPVNATEIINKYLSKWLRYYQCLNDLLLMNINKLNCINFFFINIFSS